MVCVAPAQAGFGPAKIKQQGFAAPQPHLLRNPMFLEGAVAAYGGCPPMTHYGREDKAYRLTALPPGR